MHHYVLITNVKGFIHKYKNIQSRIDNHVCRNCFNISTSKQRHEKHEILCQQNKQAIIKKPRRDQKQFRFNNVQARWFAPIEGFFYLKSLIVPVEGCKNNPEKEETRAIEINKPCSYALLFVALEEQKPFFFDLQCGPMLWISL